MSVIIGNKKVRKVGVLTEPNTYDGNLTPPDMQYGTIGYAQGKRIVGTGKAFEFARYGKTKIKNILDENGNEIYGCEIREGGNANILFITSYKGDAFFQNTMIVALEENSAIEIGKNNTTGSILYAFKKGEMLYIYSTTINDIKSQYYYFIGKDNYL